MSDKPMGLKLIPTTQFKKDYKIARKRGLDISKLNDVLAMLSAEIELPPYCRDHALIGNYAGFRECHVQADWLLVYAIDGEKLILTASRTGTHSDLFNK